MLKTFGRRCIIFFTNVLCSLGRRTSSQIYYTFVQCWLNVGPEIGAEMMDQVARGWGIIVFMILLCVLMND